MRTLLNIQEPNSTEYVRGLAQPRVSRIVNTQETGSSGLRFGIRSGRFGDRLIKGAITMDRDSGIRRGPGFADQRSTRGARNERAGEERGVDRRPRLQINTQRAPGYKYAVRTRRSDCINCRRKEEQNRGGRAAAAQSEFKAAHGVRQKNVRHPSRFIGPRHEDSFAVNFFRPSTAELRFSTVPSNREASIAHTSS